MTNSLNRQEVSNSQPRVKCQLVKFIGIYLHVKIISVLMKLIHNATIPFIFGTD